MTTSTVTPPGTDDPPHCPACGYTLVLRDRGRCPECGTAVRVVAVATTGLHSPSWWIALFGTSLSALLWILMLLRVFSRVGGLLENPNLPGAVRAGIASSSSLPDWPGVVVTLTGCLGTLAALAWLLATRRAFMSLPAGRRTACAVAGLLLPFATLGIAAVYVYWVR